MNANHKTAMPHELLAVCSEDRERLVEALREILRSGERKNIEAGKALLRELGESE